jgi:DNA-directed RNA polymerase I subunit RPA49
MSEKKRKRESEGEAGNSRKKAVSGAGHEKLSFKLVQTGKDELPPVIAVPAAIKIPHVSLKPYSKKISEIPLSQQSLLLHSSEHPRLDFIGDENFGNDSAALLDHYVGVYDPETGKVELHKARRLKLATTLRPTQEQLDEAKVKKDYQTPYAMRQELGMVFGTKKAKTMIKSLAENAIIQAGSGDGKLDATTQALLNSIGEKVANMPTKDEQEALSTDSAPKPKANLAAKDPKDVYPLSILIPSETLTSIDVVSWMEKAKKKEEIKTGSRFVSYRISSVAQNNDLTKMKVLRYMLVMIELFVSLKSVGRGGKKLPPRKDLNQILASSPPSLIDAVIKRFCLAS